MYTGFDFDGVLTNCGRLKTEFAKILFNVDIPSEIFKKEIVVDNGLLTFEQYRTLQREIYNNKEIGLRMYPVDGMLEYLPRIQQDGHKMLIVTSRESAGISLEWLLDRELYIPVTCVGYRNSKAVACKGMDVYVDDDIDKLEEISNVVRHRLLFTWPYNRHLNLDGTGVERVDGWKQLYDKIREIDSQIS